MTSFSPKAACALALGLACTLAPARSWSREVTPSELTVARQLFDEGKAAEDAGEFRLAAEKFRRAASIKDTPGIRFHLARCEEELGTFVEALLDYDRARELLASGMKAADVEKLLPSARERAQSKVALLTIKLPPQVGGASVELDGTALSVSVLDVAMPINPGKHRITASAAGRADYANDLELKSGESIQLELELPAAPERPRSEPTPAAAAAPSVSGASSRPRADAAIQPRTAVLVGEAALVAAGLTTGVVFTVLRSAANDRYDTATQAVLAEVGGSDPNGVACSGEMAPEPCADLAEAGRDRTRAANIAAVGFIAAGVSAAAFGLTYWLWPERSTLSSAHATVVPGGATLVFSGHF